MQAKETKLKEILEGTKQYVVPLFQRTYSWDKDNWEKLWTDIYDLYTADKPLPHFFGSIVTIPDLSTPENVAKYLLIDGQQRLTTISVVLTVLSNESKGYKEDSELSDEIKNCFLVNQYKKNTKEWIKILPTQVDRVPYGELFKPSVQRNSSGINQAYYFFLSKINRFINKANFRKLYNVISDYLSIVSITLDANDNPYLVFESLNAKGKPLTQADLIRNYLFMRIPSEEQDIAYTQLWLPMDNALSADNNLTNFIKDYLIMVDGIWLKEDSIYPRLKEKINPAKSNAETALEFLEKINKFSKYYVKFLDPTLESNFSLREYFNQFLELKITTCYPILLALYHHYTEGSLERSEFLQCLEDIENLLVRRFVCNYPSNQFNKVFPSISHKIFKQTDSINDNLRELLSSPSGFYPKDSEFFNNLRVSKLYGNGLRLANTMIILKKIETSYGHKEFTAFPEKTTVEHILPQTLSEWWENHLGDEKDDTYELYLHTIGNLTLTAYNGELSNKSFDEKKQILKESKFNLNKYFLDKEVWKRTEIEKRSEFLAQKAIEIWPYYGKNTDQQLDKGVTGKKPISLTILGRSSKPKTWRDVLETSLNAIHDFDPDKFRLLVNSFPKHVNKDKTKFRDARILDNGYYFECNRSASSIEMFCVQAFEFIGLTSEDWLLEYE